MRDHQCVDRVPAREQMGPIDAQLVGQVLSWDTLGDAAENLDDDGTAIAGFPPDRSSEQVKDCAALPAAVLRNDRSAPPVGRLIWGQRVAVWTVQAVRVQNMQQEVITRLFIEQAIKRKSEH